MVFFRSEERAQDWCVTHGQPLRPLLSSLAKKKGAEDCLFGPSQQVLAPVRGQAHPGCGVVAAPTANMNAAQPR